MLVEIAIVLPRRIAGLTQKLDDFRQHKPSMDTVEVPRIALCTSREGVCRWRRFQVKTEPERVALGLKAPTRADHGGRGEAAGGGQ